MNEHPVPWQIHIRGHSANVIDGDGEPIMSFASVDADFWQGIVKAVNSHDAMVKAMEDLLLASAAVAEWHANWELPFADDAEWSGDAKQFRDKRAAARDALNAVSTPLTPGADHE